MPPLLRRHADARARAVRSATVAADARASSATVLALAIALLVAACGSSGTPVPAPGGSAGASAEPGAPSAVPPAAASIEGPHPSPPPWSVPSDQVGLIRMAGLTPLTAEGTVQHTHSELQVWYSGQRVIVPADVGIDNTAQQLSPIHTHDRSGIIHVESPTPGTFRLGQFFTEWGVPLAGAKAWVDGKPLADPASIVLVDRQFIVVAWGTPPSPIPSSYTGGYYPGQQIPDLAPAITLAGVPSGFGPPVVAGRYNDETTYLLSLSDQGAQREQPLVAGKLRAFEVKASDGGSKGAVEVFLWHFDSPRSAAAYRAQSAVFVPGTQSPATGVAPDAHVVFGPDPSQSDGSTLGQVAWTHGSWAIVVVASTAKGVLDQNGLLAIAKSVASQAGTLPA